jgi:hypothetical protein
VHRRDLADTGCGPGAGQGRREPGRGEVTGLVGLAGCAVAEGLVRADGVIDLPEPVDLDRERVTVADLTAVEVLVFQGAEEPFDDSVALRALDPSADMAHQRVLTGEGLSKHLTTETRPVVGDHRDRRRDLPDDRVSGSRMSITARSARRSGSPVSRVASVTACCRQASASAPRLVGVTVMARQYLVA